MYQINDMILYGTEGVCKIDSIVTKELAGEAQEYYVLKPVYSENSTIYVPVHNKNLTKKMHQVLSTQEIYQLIENISDEQPDWIENENERKEKFKEIMSSGKRSWMLQMIKSLYHHQQEQQERENLLHV